MFSGKSDELINVYNYTIQNFANSEQIIAFRPTIDIRSKTIVSRTGKMIPSFSVEKASDILGYIKDNTKYVLIDEYQFFDKNLVEVLPILLKKKISVIMGGLDYDFRRKHFPLYELLKSSADMITKTVACCEICGKSAFYSMKLINDKPATSSSKTVEIEIGKNNIRYIAVCKKHHEV